MKKVRFSLVYKRVVYKILYITLNSVTRNYFFKKMIYFFSRPLAVVEKMAEKMAERGELKTFIVEAKKTNEKMVEREDLNVEDKRAADIETIKAIKQLMLQMLPLIKPAQYCDEAAFMHDMLADEIEKFEIMTLTDEEIVKLLNEEDED